METITKLALSTALLSIAATSYAGCQEDFETFKTTATNMLPQQLRSDFSKTTMKIGEVSNEDTFVTQTYKIGPISTVRAVRIKSSLAWEGKLNGKAVRESNRIEIECNEDSETNKAVIAHEIGHFVADALGLPSTEDQANIFGAEIFFQSGIDSANYLKIIDGKCAQSNQYFCQLATAWRIGLKGG